MSKRFFVMTDLEGVVGVDAWEQVRHTDDNFDPAAEARAMDELAREINACIEGIREMHPDADIDIFDGHGTGGVRPEDIRGGEYLRVVDPHVFHPLVDHDYDAMLYVGQHAMAGTAFAPLRHTRSSLTIEYYKLNDTFIGEFAGGAIAAGIQDVPTVFLAGDDKACLEAEMFVPEIETAPVKRGRGEEAADHHDQCKALNAIRDGATCAVRRLDEIPPLDSFEPPYTVEIRYCDPVKNIPERYDVPEVTADKIDKQTIQARSETFTDVYP